MSAVPSFNPFRGSPAARPAAAAEPAVPGGAASLTPEQIAAAEAAAAQARAEEAQRAQALEERRQRLAAAAQPQRTETTREYRMGFKAGAKAERARFKAIVLSPIALHNPEGALIMACDTDMDADTALAVLQTYGAARRAAAPVAAVEPQRSLDDRMAAVTQPAVGAGGPEPVSGEKPTAAFIIAAYNKALGLDKK